MTSEISSAPELIYYCEFDPENWEDRLEITFSNKHIVILKFLSFKAGEIEIEIDIQLKNLLVPVGFFGDHILNTIAIVGKNGVGKSNILKGIFINENHESYESFNIYKVHDFLFLIELSDRENVFIKNKNTGIQIYTTREPYLDSVNGQYIKEEKCSNALIIGMNFHEENHKVKNYVYKRIFLEPNNAETLELIQDVLFMESFFEKKVMPIIKTNDIVDFYNEDQKFHNGQSNYVVKADILQKSLSDLKILFLFYISITVLRFCLQENGIEPSNEQEQEFNNLEDAIHKILSIMQGKSVRHTEKYPNLIKKKSIDLYDLMISLLNCISSIECSVDIYKRRLVYKVLVSNAEDTFNLLESIDLLNKVTNLEILEVLIGEHSSGERYILEQFSSLRKTLKKVVENPFILYDSIKYNSVILLIDEYEQYLHPEWSRKYLSHLLRFLKIESVNLNIKIQIIITTHSPYLISDLPKENIRLIQKNEKTGRRTVSIPKHGFASNYYDILSDSFFLEDTIGEFAKQKINSWIKELNELGKKNIAAFKDDDQEIIWVINKTGLNIPVNLLIYTDREKITRIDELKVLIHIVDDQFIRNKLLELAEDVRCHILTKAEKSKSSRIKLIEQEIERLKAMKNQLSEESEND